MNSMVMFGDLVMAGRTVLNRRTESAKGQLLKMLQSKVGVETGNKELIKHMIAESLLRRIDDDLVTRQHIYLEKFDVSQIDMFAKMGEAYPHVFVSHDIANQYQLSVIEDREEISFFDIGIGQGLQLKRFLLNVNARDRKPKKINVIGLDPDPQNLEDCRLVMEEIREEVSFEMTYKPICNFLERFTDKDFEEIRKIGGDNLIINSAFALHHLQDNPLSSEVRSEAMARLHALKPLVFTLIEPHVNHYTDNLVERIRECTSHFGTVFDLIDRSNVDKKYKYLVKEHFFGREIRDIFGVKDSIRAEKHERTDSWLARLVGAGFQPHLYNDIRVNLPDYCESTVNDGLVHLGYEGVELITVFAYKY